LRPGATRSGRASERNVADDFRRAFGIEPPPVNGVIVSSDTDNTGEEARAGFADLRFVAKDESC